MTVGTSESTRFDTIGSIGESLNEAVGVMETGKNKAQQELVDIDNRLPEIARQMKECVSQLGECFAGSIDRRADGLRIIGLLEGFRRRLSVASFASEKGVSLEFLDRSMGNKIGFITDALAERD